PDEDAGGRHDGHHRLGEQPDGVTAPPCRSGVHRVGGLVPGGHGVLGDGHVSSPPITVGGAGAAALPSSDSSSSCEYSSRRLRTVWMRVSMSIRPSYCPRLPVTTVDALAAASRASSASW